MESITKTQYHHLKSDKVYYHSKDFQDNSLEIQEFQQTDQPEKLGFTYERDFRPIEAEKPETV